MPLKSRAEQLTYLSGYRKKHPHAEKIHLTRCALKKAIRNVGVPLKNREGWPDASRVEVKISRDFIRWQQFLRFAWLEQTHDLRVEIQTASNHEDLQTRTGSFGYFLSVESYLRSISEDLLPFWADLKNRFS